MSRAAIEAAIRANRDDGACYDVYADWLSAHDDPFGELIALERRDDPALRPRIIDLRAELVRWPEHAGNDVRAMWRWGLWDTVAIACSTGSTDGRYDAPALAEFAFPHPACAVLRHLHFDLHDWRFAGDVEVPPVLAAAEGHAWARELDQLSVGVFELDAYDVSSRIGRCSAAISRIFSGLRHLVLFGADIELGELVLSRLRELHVVTHDPIGAWLGGLLAAQLPALEQVELDGGTRGPGPPPGQLAAIVDGRFPRLRSLSLRGAGIADELARALPGSPFAAQVEHLELALTDDTALALTGAQFPRLRSLMIRGIGNAVRRQLATRFPRVALHALSSGLDVS